MTDLKMISTNELLSELGNRHYAMMFMGIPFSSHNDILKGDCKITKNIKGNTILILGLCEMMKQASFIAGITNCKDGKDMDLSD